MKTRSTPVRKLSGVGGGPRRPDPKIEVRTPRVRAVLFPLPPGVSEHAEQTAQQQRDRPRLGNDFDAGGVERGPISWPFSE